MNKRNQFLSVPCEHAETYEVYMRSHKIPFKKMGYAWNRMLGQAQVTYRLPRNRRPHAWKLKI